MLSSGGIDELRSLLSYAKNITTGNPAAIFVRSAITFSAVDGICGVLFCQKKNNHSRQFFVGETGL